MDPNRVLEKTSHEMTYLLVCNIRVGTLIALFSPNAINSDPNVFFAEILGFYRLGKKPMLKTTTENTYRPTFTL